MLRDQSLLHHVLNSLFEALILSWFQCAFTARYCFLSAELSCKINSFLRRVHKCGFWKTIVTIQDPANTADRTPFRKMSDNCHCLHHLLSSITDKQLYLRPKRHSFDLIDVLLSFIKDVFRPLFV